jgi:hypothetical protein
VKALPLSKNWRVVSRAPRLNTSWGDSLSDREKQVALLTRILWQDLLEQDERDWAGEHPAHLISKMTAVDEREATEFGFAHVAEPLGDDYQPIDERTALANREDKPDWAHDWRWQREAIDLIHKFSRTIWLKARQLGMTWIACAYLVWVMLYMRGSLCLIYRQKEEEAHENVARCWQLLNSLPKHLWNGAEVVKPDRGAFASSEIIVRFPNGTRSRIAAMTSASASGHGKTAAAVLTDEHSRIERAEEIQKAIEPAAGTKGKIIVVSTANGVSDDEGNGNQFAWIWKQARAKTNAYKAMFLGWFCHPDRDWDWYENDPQVTNLRTHEKAEQYPTNEFEAFSLTNRVFFDPNDLNYYGALIPEPLYQADFRMVDARTARLDKHDRGSIRVYVEPKPGCHYAIGGDVATGRGRDYSYAPVIDLATMEIAAEFHGRLDADQFAFQLHYMGRWYNTALIAPETAGGFGEAVIIALRDGRAGRPPYPNLYRHVMSSRPDLPIAKTYGFPTNTKTRPLILNQMEQVVRERTIPWLTSLLLHEMQTFVYHETGTSPRAQEGTRDDCVMGTAIGLEMFRLRGHHPDRQLPPGRKSRIVGLGRGKRKNSLADIAAKYPV